MSSFLVDITRRSSFRCVLLIAPVWLAVFSPSSAGADEADPVLGKSRFERDLEDAEVLMFKGRYDEAFRRSEYARIALHRQGGMEKMLLDSVLDTLQGEIRTAQGYFSTAKRLLRGAEKTLDQKAAWWARRGMTVNDLKHYNFRRGYVNLLLGDVAFAESRIESILGEDDGVLRRCRPYYAKGIEIIRDTWRKTDSEGLEIQVRLFYKAELREVLMLILDDDLERAQSVYDELERFIFTNDLEWQRLFHPDGVVGAALAGKGPQMAGPPPPGQGQAGSAADASPDSVESSLVTSSQISLKASDQERSAVRVSLLYIDLLSVKSRLYLAMDELPVAEEAAAYARDIAEERFPNGRSHFLTMLDLADVYLACYEQQTVEARHNRDAVFELDGRTLNIHQTAADSYLADVEELVEKVEKESASLNPANPIHFLAADLRRRVAMVKKNPDGIKDAEAVLSRLAEARQQDRPKRVK